MVEREPGYYWVAREWATYVPPQREWEIAYWDGMHWFRSGTEDFFGSDEFWSGIGPRVEIPADLPKREGNDG